MVLLQQSTYSVNAQGGGNFQRRTLRSVSRLFMINWIVHSSWRLRFMTKWMRYFLHFTKIPIRRWKKYVQAAEAVKR